MEQRFRINKSSNFYIMNEQQVEKALGIATLITKHIQDNLADEEWNMLETWLAENDENNTLFEEIQDPGLLGRSMAELRSCNTENSLCRLKEKLNLVPPPGSTPL